VRSGRAGGLQIDGLAKSYAGVTVLSDVDLSVPPGEIHALLGANGAGKSTLIKCISGAVVPEAGRIRLDGEELAHGSPADTRRAGVAVIYQEFSLAQTLSVADNVFLGSELRRGPFVRRRAQSREAGRLLASLGAGHISARSLVEDMSGANQQVVEIAKAMRARPRLLILDEPTASLTRVETDRLMTQLRQLRQQNLPTIYVTHRLQEVHEIADRVTVLRDGRVALSENVASVGEDEIIAAITGRAQSDGLAESPSPHDPSDDLVLDLTGVAAPGIGPIDLRLRPGEVLGVYGLLGSGRSELLETIVGARPRLDGFLRLDGTEVSFKQPAAAIAAGIAYVPAERRKQALFAAMGALDNLLMPSLGRLSRRGVRSRRAEREAFSKLGGSLRLVPLRAGLEVERLSGGNQQKVSVGRWLAADRELRALLLDEPTQGVDVGARRQLYDLLRRLAAEKRVGVMLTSSDPGELEAVADRVVVLSRGRAVGELSGAAIDEAALVRLAHTRDEAA